ncbi:hypothetical protein G5V58_17180 [Nocardioides anomalus]|uniref:Uncharacterized protein n=1 Tax=Nocardioides anomalus TaxID=2712223 RepID=A0A6G6WGQ8_9ACTN|nr:hypothetical protein [Nocardioides anomalus]QIG44275.1 hypothetical protein G5V58_17180 [Nocardioides anomalus]
MSTSRSGAALLLALLALAACGAPEGVASRVPEPPAPTKAAPAPWTPTTPGDLAAALPGASDLHPWRVVHRCAGRDPCTRADDGRTAFVLAAGARPGETVLVGATRWPSTERAAAVPVRALIGGRFRTPVQRTAPRSWRLGEAGRATVAAYDADGWVDRRREAVLRLLQPGGRRSPPCTRWGWCWRASASPSR